jgi:hypothetical protein
VHLFEMYSNIVKRNQHIFLFRILYNWVGQMYNPSKSQLYKEKKFALNFLTLRNFLFLNWEVLDWEGYFLYFQIVSNPKSLSYFFAGERGKIKKKILSLGLEPITSKVRMVLPLHHTPTCVRIVISLYIYIC